MAKGGRSCPILAKGKKHRSRADEERVTCLPWTTGEGCQLSRQKGQRGHPKRPLGTKIYSLSLASGGRVALLQAKEKEQTSHWVKEVGTAITTA